METTQRHTVPVVELGLPSVKLSLSLYFQPFDHETSGVPGWRAVVVVVGWWGEVLTLVLLCTHLGPLGKCSWAQRTGCT